MSVSANSVSRLRRFARFKLVRALVFLLALVVLANTVTTAARPLPMTDAVTPTVAAGMAGEHCVHHAAAKPSIEHGHGEGCPCCIGKACACAPGCVVGMAVALTTPQRHRGDAVAAMPAPAPYATRDARPLRPPIA